MSIEIRQAKKEEVGLVLKFIKGIAEYEKLSDQVEANEEILYDSLFVKEDAKVIIAFDENKTPLGFALYFYNFSTFKGKKGLYLEDLFVYPEHRGKGYGNMLFKYLITEAKKNNCGRMEWVCLKWNRSAIEFYNKKGAQELSEWTTFRLDENKF